MKYELRIPAIYGDVIPLILVASEMARAASTAHGKTLPHKPAYNGRLPMCVKLLLNESRAGRLRVCNQFEHQGSAEELLAAAKSSGDLSVVSRYLIEPDWEKLHQENAPILPGIGMWDFTGIDFGQKNKCWRVYEWNYQSLGLLTLTEVPAATITAHSPPWPLQWLQCLARPIALEYSCWRRRRGYETNPNAAKRYSQWLLQTLGTKLRADRVRAELTKHLALDPWSLKIASWFLRPHDMPQRALLADYNCVLARRATFAKLESDGPHLIGLYGALCRARRFPRAGEPLQRLRAYLMANDISPQTWTATVNAPARFWLIVNRYYTGTSACQVLDLIRCIDVLGFDRTPPPWLLDALLAPHGGPGSRYPSYAFEVSKNESVWRHVVRLQNHIEMPTETQSRELKRVVDWVDQTVQHQLTRAQRQAGWRWMIGKSLRWEKQKKIELMSSGMSWWVPAKEVAVGGYEFRFLATPLEVWEEGQAMRHCAFDLVRGCEMGVCLVVSIKREGLRVATLELRLPDDQWRINQLRGKRNIHAKKAVWLCAYRLLKLLTTQQYSAPMDNSD